LSRSVPSQVNVRSAQDGIDQHQPLHDSAERRRFPMSVVGLAHGGVERLARDVVTAGRDAARQPRWGGHIRAQRASGGSRASSAVDDANEGLVLTRDEDAAVRHHFDEEGRLSLRHSSCVRSRALSAPA
jgi:hypothetical protein